MWIQMQIPQINIDICKINSGINMGVEPTAIPTITLVTSHIHWSLVRVPLPSSNGAPSPSDQFLSLADIENTPLYPK